MDTKDNHPRVGPRTEVANPDESVEYAEISFGISSLMWDSEDSPSSKSGYRIVTTVFGSGSQLIYKNVEQVSEETAHQILDKKNGGYWGYVE